MIKKIEIFITLFGLFFPITSFSQSDSSFTRLYSINLKPSYNYTIDKFDLNNFSLTIGKTNRFGHLREYEIHGIKFNRDTIAVTDNSGNSWKEMQWNLFLGFNINYFIPLTKSFSKKIIPIIGPGMTFSYDRTKTRQDTLFFPKIQTRISNILQFKFGLQFNREKFFWRIYIPLPIYNIFSEIEKIENPQIPEKQRRTTILATDFFNFDNNSINIGLGIRINPTKN